MLLMQPDELKIAKQTPLLFNGKNSISFALLKENGRMVVF